MYSSLSVYPSLPAFWKRFRTPISSSIDMASISVMARLGDQVFLSLKKANVGGVRASNSYSSTQTDFPQIKTDLRRFEVDISSEAPLFLSDGVAMLLGEAFVLRVRWSLSSRPIPDSSVLKATAHVLKAVSRRYSVQKIFAAPRDRRERSDAMHRTRMGPPHGSISTRSRKRRCGLRQCCSR